MSFVAYYTLDSAPSGVAYTKYVKHKKRSATHPLQPNEAEYCVIDGKRKRKYPTQLDAELHAPARELQQYVCEVCGSWHNGSGRKLKSLHIGDRLK